MTNKSHDRFGNIGNLAEGRDLQLAVPPPYLSKAESEVSAAHPHFAKDV